MQLLVVGCLLLLVKVSVSVSVLAVGCWLLGVVVGCWLLVVAIRSHAVELPSWPYVVGVLLLVCCWLVCCWLLVVSSRLFCWWYWWLLLCCRLECCCWFVVGCGGFSMTDFKLPVGGVVSVVTVDCFRERGDTGGADNGSEGV